MNIARHIATAARTTAAWTLSLGPLAWITAALLLGTAALYLAAGDTITATYATATAYLADMGPLGWALAGGMTLAALALAAAAALTARRR